MRWFLVTILLSAACSCWAMDAAGPSHGGEEVAVDFPVSLRTRNVGGSDGAGLCVFTSIGHSARWAHVAELEDFQKWMRQYPGGGYPQKVDAMIKRKCGSNVPLYLQYEGMDPSIIRAAIDSGRMPAVTYDGRDMHYRSHIEHMVNVVAYSDKWVVVLDNNFIGENELVWLTPDEFRDRWIGRGGGGRQGWAVVLLAPGAPPVPQLPKPALDLLRP